MYMSGKHFLYSVFPVTMAVIEDDIQLFNKNGTWFDLKL